MSNLEVPWKEVTASGNPSGPWKEVDEYTWDRVLKMRKDKHPLIFGGKAIKPERRKLEQFFT